MADNKVKKIKLHNKQNNINRFERGIKKTEKMKKVEIKRKKSLLKGLFMRFAVMAATLLLLTNCGSNKAVVSASDDITSQSSGYQLSDDCALLHLYRPGSMMGMAISYDLHLDDEVVFRVKNKSKTTIRITSEGLKTLWAKTESKTELPVDIRLGREYYIQCGVGMGAFVGRPRLKIVDNEKGKVDFAKISSQKK